MSRRAYLDCASSTPLRPEVLEAMLPFLREHHADPGRLVSAEEPRRALLRLPPTTALALVSGDGVDEFVTRLACSDPPVEVGSLAAGRFLVRAAGSEALAEDSWDGGELTLGEAVVRVGGPVRRCAATTRNPDTGEIDLQTLKLIGGLKGREEFGPWGAGFYLGVYADVLVPGRVAVGDEVVLR